MTRTLRRLGKMSAAAIAYIVTWFVCVSILWSAYDHAREIWRHVAP